MTEQRLLQHYCAFAVSRDRRPVLKASRHTHFSFPQLSTPNHCQRLAFLDWVTKPQRTCSSGRLCGVLDIAISDASNLHNFAFETRTHQRVVIWIDIQDAIEHQRFRCSGRGDRGDLQADVIPTVLENLYRLTGLVWKNYCRLGWNAARGQFRRIAPGLPPTHRVGDKQEWRNYRCHQQ